jgi:hypothetical protein
MIYLFWSALTLTGSVGLYRASPCCMTDRIQKVVATGNKQGGLMAVLCRCLMFNCLLAPGDPDQTQQARAEQPDG